MLALALLSEIVAFVARQPSPYDYPYGSGNERFCSDSFYTIYDAVSGVPLLIILMKQPSFFLHYNHPVKTITSDWDEYTRIIVY